MSAIDVTVSKGSPALVTVGSNTPINVTAGTTGPPGPQGPVGPAGPEGGTPVVAIAYDAWPPVNPQPDTLYLRLTP